MWFVVMVVVTFYWLAKCQHENIINGSLSYSNQTGLTIVRNIVEKFSAR